MKYLLMVFRVVMMFATDYAMAQNYAVAIDGSKPFESEIVLYGGEQITFDIYLEEAPGQAIAGGAWVDFSGSTDSLSYVSAGRAFTDGSEGVTGPWQPSFGVLVIPPGGGTIIMVVGRMEGGGASLDGDGDIIIGRITLESTAVCYCAPTASITIATIPAYNTWGPSDNGWDDAAVNAATVNPVLVINPLPDADDDGVPDESDNCPDEPNPNQDDTDEGGGDGVGDACDNCPDDFNPAQQNHDSDALGDVCDPDDDNDGICDPEESDPSCSGSDICPYDPDNDGDGDAICGDIDNCPGVENPGQEDIGDGDGVGDACDNCPYDDNLNQRDRFPPQGNNIGDACDCEGNFDCDLDVDGEDVTAFLMDFGRGTYDRPCENGDQCSGDFTCDGDVDADDITKVLEDFGRGQYSNPCPACGEGGWCDYPQ
jgi:hypothetical protein